MNTVYDLKENCYGCNGCLNICPTKAIVTVEDEEGFLYPEINKDKCIECGMCQATCPIYRSKNINIDFKQQFFAIKHKSESTRLLSSSGGVFTAISDYVLEKGGVVYGAVLDDELKVCHQRAVTKAKRNEMRGSKYVQSDTGECFLLVKKDLQDGKQVLFVGTPCQIAGLQLYLEKEDNLNLILCDIICHGVPSNLMWYEYKELVKSKKGKIKLHYFRTKINGWHSMTSRNIFINGKEDYKSALSQIHINLFFTDLLLRQCCYQCKYSSYHRDSDLTIADFWGIERSLPEFYDNKGISLVITNTQKGEEILTCVKDNIVIKESDMASCFQRNLKQPTLCPSNRGEFWNNYKEHGYEYVAKKYADYTFNARLRAMLHYQIMTVKKVIIKDTH